MKLVPKTDDAIMRGEGNPESCPQAAAEQGQSSTNVLHFRLSVVIYGQRH